MVDVEMRVTPGEIQTLRESHAGVRVETVMVRSETEVIVRIFANTEKKLREAQHHLAHLKCLRNALEGLVPKEGA